MAVPRRTQAERRAHTRSALLAAARGLFTERGYADTTVSEIAARAGVSNGALYHLFPDKRALMAALFEESQVEVLGRVGAVIAPIADPFERFRAGCQAFLDAALDPAIQRIVVVEARTVLGEAAWHEIEARYGLGALQGGLAAIPGVTPAVAEAAGQMLLGALGEAALFIARSTVQQDARHAAGKAIERLLEGFRPRG
jgi:AcrR family transcriptional regulator